MIKVEELSVHIDGKELVRSLSFSVAPGEKAVLCGESGSGKTSVLRTLTGMHRPSHGRVFLNGQKVAPETIGMIRRKIAYVPQSLSFFEDEIVRDYMLLPFRLRANRDVYPSEIKVEQMLERFRLDRSLLDTLAREVSGGESQRLALARALLLERDVLLLDEVTAALDSENQRIVQDAIFADAKSTVLAVTHDEDWIAVASPCIELKAACSEEEPNGQP